MFQNSALPSVTGDITRNIVGALPRVRSLPKLAQVEHIFPLPTTLREYLTWLLVMAGVSVLALLQVWATLQINHARNELNELQTQSVLVEQENAQLLWEISHFTTLDRVQREAVASGYVPVLKRRYIAAEAPTVISPDSPSVPIGLAEPATAWSVDVKLKPAEMLVEASALGYEWWAGMQANIGTRAAAARDLLAQKLAQFDINSFFWIGNPR